MIYQSGARTFYPERKIAYVCAAHEAEEDLVREARFKMALFPRASYTQILRPRAIYKSGRARVRNDQL